MAESKSRSRAWDRLAFIAPALVILGIMPLLFLSTSVICSSLCISNFTIKGNELSMMAKYDGTAIPSGMIGVVLDGRYADTIEPAGKALHFSAPLAFGKNTMIFKYGTATSTVVFWYFDGYLGFIALPLGLSVFALLFQTSRALAARHCIRLYAMERNSGIADDPINTGSVVSVAMEKCKKRMIVKDLPIIAHEFAAEARLLSGRSNPELCLGLEQKIAKAGLTSGVNYSSGMLSLGKPEPHIRLVSVRKIYDIALSAGGYSFRRCTMAAQFLSRNGIILAGDATPEGVFEVVGKLGKARMFFDYHCRGPLPAISGNSRFCYTLLFLRMSGIVDFVEL